MKNSPQQNSYLYTVPRNKQDAYEFLMAFPACESFALSSLGFMWLAKKLEERPDISLTKIYTDTAAFPDIRAIKAISFSLSYEMDYIGVLEVLEKLNLPLFAKDREKIFVFAGGPVITSNPAPFADFFDFFLIGDGEDLLLQVMEILKSNQDKTKKEVLELLKNVQGVYIPLLKNITMKITAPLDEAVFSPVLSESAYFANTFIVEVERGCYNRCGFCLASYLNLPVRYVDYDEIINKIELGLTYTKKIALLGAQVSAHPKFNEICDYVIKKIESGVEIELNFSSLRIDAINEQVIKLLRLSGQKTFTVAIEAATERLRKVINKNVKESELFKALEYAYNGGMRGVKVYCMLGLPIETEADVQAFVELAKRLKSFQKGFELTFSFSTFVPKPHTPFQWCAHESNQSLEKKQKFLTKELAKIGVKTKFSSAKWDYYQTLISRGDESLGDYLYEVYKRGGKIGDYKSVAKELGVDTDFFVTRIYDLDDVLPWDNIIIEHPGKDLLKNEFNRLMKKADLE